MSVDASYLREQAQRLIRLARTCSDQAVSHELEAVSMEFMAKAGDLEKLVTLSENDNKKGKSARN
jgi:hypothetical protein